jgi:hypothetical protein
MSSSTKYSKNYEKIQTNQGRRDKDPGAPMIDGLALT